MLCIFIKPQHMRYTRFNICWAVLQSDKTNQKVQTETFTACNPCERWCDAWIDRSECHSSTFVRDRDAIMLAIHVPEEAVHMCATVLHTFERRPCMLDRSAASQLDEIWMDGDQKFTQCLTRQMIPELRVIQIYYRVVWVQARGMDGASVSRVAVEVDVNRSTCVLICSDAQASL